MDEELAREDVLRAIDVAVEELLSAAGIENPPVDALGLVQRHLGLAVSIGQGSGSRKRGPLQVVLTTSMSEEAVQWTAARAAGDYMKAQLQERLGGAVPGPIPALFAEHLLLPTCWFARDAVAHGFDVPELKVRYQTATLDTIAFRLLDLPELCVITLADLDRVLRRRSNGPRIRKQLEAPERECLEYVSEYNEPHLVRSGCWTVQGWPAPSGGWPRVLLRSTVEMD